MDQYITGGVIKSLRIKNKMTQFELAEKLFVSDKTVSKWETGKGYPDISLLEPIAKVFRVSITELFSGIAISNINVCANMNRSNFYVCPICGNVLHSVGEAVIYCHGVQLFPLIPELSDENHKLFIEKSDGEYYVQVEHEMGKSHYISFIAAVSSDRVQIVKLYPEGIPEARFMINNVKTIFYYCNKDGLFYSDVVKDIDDKDRAYDDTQNAEN